MESLNLNRLLKDIFKEASKEAIKEELLILKKELLHRNEKEELLTREQTASLLQINLSTLHFWTKANKLQSYAISGRRYYKRSQIMEALKLLKR